MLPFLLAQSVIMSNCIGFNNTEVSVLTSTLPETTLADVTQVPTNCDYYSEETYIISPSQQIFNSVILQNQAINIAFDIKLNDYCNKSLCNILYIHNQDNIG
eukprot:226510_1